jgi:hypothetical protein
MGAGILREDCATARSQSQGQSDIPGIAGHGIHYGGSPSADFKSFRNYSKVNANYRFFILVFDFNMNY